MKIPDRLLFELVIFASDHYLGKGLRSSPQMMGVSCGELASTWLAARPTLEPVGIDDRMLVIAACGRFGKHVGEFFLTEREVE